MLKWRKAFMVTAAQPLIDLDQQLEKNDAVPASAACALATDACSTDHATWVLMDFS